MLFFLTAKQNQRSNTDAPEQCDEESLLHQCYICSFETYKWEEFEAHCREELEKQVKRDAECSLPSTARVNPQGGTQKAMKSSQSERYQCSLCDYGSKWKLNVTHHIGTAHSECEDVKILTSSPWTAKCHVRPFLCSICDYRWMHSCSKASLIQVWMPFVPLIHFSH